MKNDQKQSDAAWLDTILKAAKDAKASVKKSQPRILWLGTDKKRPPAGKSN
jgi:hypothetical protein